MVCTGHPGLQEVLRRSQEDLGALRIFDDEDVWYAVDAIPPNTAAAIALFEHRWAIPFRDAIVRAGGFVLADEWIHAKDLVAVGVLAAAEAELEAELEEAEA